MGDEPRVNTEIGKPRALMVRSCTVLVREKMVLSGPAYRSTPQRGMAWQEGRDGSPVSDSGTPYRVDASQAAERMRGIGGVRSPRKVSTNGDTREDARPIWVGYW